MINIEAYRVAIGSFLGRTQALSHKKLSGFGTNKHFYSRSYENVDESSDTFQSSTMSRLHFLKLFMFFLIILTMYANLNVSLIKLMRILNDGDVESNPGPTYRILKVVQGSFHQGDI